MAQTVDFQRRGAVGTLTLDTGNLNVLGLDAVQALRHGIATATFEDGIRCLVLRGRSGAFSAGLDLGVVAAGGPAAAALLGEMGELLCDLYGGPLPVVAACTGHAVAAGAMLLLVSDVRVGVEGDHRIGFSEVARGLALPEAAIELARERLSPRVVTVATMTGRLFDPLEAVAAGFLDAVLPAADAEDRIAVEAERLAAIPSDAYAATLRRVRGTSLARIRAFLDT